MYAIRQIAISLVITCIMTINTAYAELIYQQKLILTNWKSQEHLEQQVKEFCDAARGDPDIRVVGVKTCYVSKADKDLMRINGKVFQQKHDLVANAEIPCIDIFYPEGSKVPHMQGKIENGRYYAPENIFSCQACDFGEGVYIAQDGLLEQAACVCVGFYNDIGDNKKAEVLLMPWLENRKLGQKALKNAFESFGIGILKTLDNAQGIEVLKEEIVEENVFFAAISIEKMSKLIASDGEHMSSTKGYLVFQNGDKLVILSNQKVTLPNQKHDPKKHIEELKQDILEFEKTFKFGPIPISLVEKIKAGDSSTS